MHIPDGMLDVKVAAASAAAGAAVLGYAVYGARQVLKREDVPRIALAGAFIFAAQMFNFPVPGGTSGHFLGGALAFILFGPRVGLTVMAAVLGVQALLFHDGGMLALGANVLCTGLIGGMAGYAIYKTGRQWAKSRRSKMIVSFAAGWGSIVAASLGVALLLGLSGALPFGTAITAMMGWHALIGLGEGLITALVLAYVADRKTVAAGEAVSA